MNDDKEKEMPATPEETADSIQEVADSVVGGASKEVAEAQMAVVDGEEETEEESPIVSANPFLDLVAIETDPTQLMIPCENVEEDEVEDLKRQLHAHMVLLGEQALGLSAIQIGISKRAFAVRIPRKDAPMRRNASFEEKYDLMFFINADLLYTQYPKRVKESCLSIPREEFNVERFNRVKIIDDINGEQLYKNKLGQVIQHELDHTHGITLWQSGQRIVVEVAENAKVKPEFLSIRERMSLVQSMTAPDKEIKEESV
ncbi:peptide deformylase [Candidatus Pacearchaeota archaeon]|nr:peptide deformylase [Candidatus Pacearchaeota archaeon]